MSIFRTVLNQANQISGSASYDDTYTMSSAETYLNKSLEKDLNYLRTQLKTIIGKPNWYDVPDIDLHDINLVSGSLSNIYTFTGMDDRNDSTPTYSSTNYVANDDSLETAIGKLDAATKNYVDTVSGSIGNDLNHQVLELYDYIDTTSGSCAQSLQGVTNIGNITTKDIKAQNFYINYDGPDGDSYLYFYENSSQQGAYLRWVEGTTAFYLSHSLSSAGILKAGSDIYINYNGGEGDSHLYFYENTSQTGAYLMWDDNPGEFVLSHDLNVGGKVTANIISGSSFRTLSTLDNIHIGGTLTSIGNITTQGIVKANTTSGSSFRTLTSFGDLFIGGNTRITGAILDLWDGVLIVSKDSQGDYSTVHDAVNAASAGQTVLIMPGTYDESVTMKDGVNLVGIDKDNCILKYTGEGSTIIATGSGGNKICFIINLTIDHDNASGYAFNITGTAIGGTFRGYVHIRDCIVLTTTGYSAIAVEGGYVTAKNSIIQNLAGEAVTIKDGVSNTTGSFFAHQCVISGTTIGVNQRPYGLEVELFDCKINGETDAAFIQQNANGTMTIDNCYCYSASHAVGEVVTGITEPDLRICNSHLISNGTNLIDLISGTATIGFYNNVINNDTKPAGLTVTAGVEATNYGATNILR